MNQQVALRLRADIVTADVGIDPAATPPVSPEVLPVNACTLISFRITVDARTRWIFSTQPAPIVMHDGGEVFDAPVRRSDSWVTMLDRKTVDGEFAYTINLVDKQTGALLSIDPWVRNE